MQTVFVETLRPSGVVPTPLPEEALAGRPPLPPELALGRPVEPRSDNERSSIANALISSPVDDLFFDVGEFSLRFPVVPRGSGLAYEQETIVFF